MSQQLDAQGEAHEALGTAVASYGQRVLIDPHTLGNLVADLLPDLPRERSLLVAGAEADVAAEMKQHVEDQRIDPDTAVQLVARSLSERRAIDPTAGLWVVSEYAHGPGIPDPAVHRRRRGDGPPGSGRAVPAAGRAGHAPGRRRRGRTPCRRPPRYRPSRPGPRPGRRRRARSPGPPTAGGRRGFPLPGRCRSGPRASSGSHRSRSSPGLRQARRRSRGRPPGRRRSPGHRPGRRPGSPGPRSSRLPVPPRARGRGESSG